MTNVKCDCGKLLAVEKDGKIYIKCKGCKKQIDIGELIAKSQEPKSREP